MRKSQTTINIFVFLVFYILLVRKHIWKNFILLHLYQFFCMVGYCKCSNKTPTAILICIGIVHAILLHKILGNRLGILTQITIAMDYYFIISLCISKKYLQLTKKTKSFISKKYVQLTKKQNHLLRKIVGLPHTSNQI